MDSNDITTVAKTADQLLEVFDKHVASIPSDKLQEGTSETYKLIHNAICDAIKDQRKKFAIEIISDPHKEEITYAIQSTVDALEAQGWWVGHLRGSCYDELKWIISCDFTMNFGSR